MQIHFIKIERKALDLDLNGENMKCPERGCLVSGKGAAADEVAGKG